MKTYDRCNANCCCCCNMQQAHELKYSSLAILGDVLMKLMEAYSDERWEFGVKQGKTRERERARKLRER